MTPHEAQPPDRSVEYWRREARLAMRDASDALVDEVADHLALVWREARSAGLAIEDAEARVRADLDTWRARSRTPAWRRARPWIGWVGDVRHGTRGVRRRPAFAAAVVLLSALSVGAIAVSTAIGYGLLVRPLPYPEGDRLAVLWQVRQGDEGQISIPDYRDLTAGDLFAGAAGMSGGRGSLRVDRGIERVNALFIEPAGLAMLGARPALGRLLRADDVRTPNVMVSDRLWRTHFFGDLDIIGRSIWMSGQTHTIVGVLQPGFDFELPVGGVFELEKHDLWAIFDPAGPMAGRREVSGFEALVRLQDGMSLSAAQREVDARAEQLARDHAATNRDRTFRVAALHDEVVRAYRPAVSLAGLGALVTCLIAGANILTLTGIRMGERRPELALRRALGAGSFRLRRQLATEHLLLVATGAAIGLLAARRVVAWLVASEAANLPRPDAIRFDAPVIGAALLTVAFFVLLMSMAARLANRRPAAIDAVRVTAGNRRVRRVITAAELALAIVLCTGGVLFGLSLDRLLSVDPGFDATGVATARVSAYAERQAGQVEVEAFFTRVVEAIEQVPGVVRAAAGSSLALSGQSSGTSVMAEGQVVAPGSRQSAGWQYVTPGYFEAAGMRVVRGRGFTDDDRRHDGHVTIVNETLARDLFGDDDPIGRRIAVGGGDGSGDWHEIVGVVGDVRHQSLSVAAAPRVYDLFGEHWGRTLYVVARTAAGEPDVLLDAMRRAVAAIDPEAPVFESASLASLADRSSAAHRLAATMAGALSAVAVLIALVGVHAVAAVFVAERAREVGLRAALGASPRELGFFALREQLWTTVGGVALGALGSLALVRVIEARLYGVSASQATGAIPVVVLAVTVATLVATLPAMRRAAAADPLTVLRAS